MWELIVSIPDRCLSFNFASFDIFFNHLAYHIIKQQHFDIINISLKS